MKIRILQFAVLFLFVTTLFTSTASAISAPADLITHSQPADSQVVLSWTPVTGATEYRVYRGTTYGSYSLLATVSGLSHVDDTFSTSSTSSSE